MMKKKLVRALVNTLYFLASVSGGLMVIDFWVSTEGEFLSTLIEWVILGAGLLFWAVGYSLEKQFLTDTEKKRNQKPIRT